jgi:hypothetical protein
MREAGVRRSYRSGFRRIWFVISILWLLGTIFTISDWQTNKLSAFFLGGVLPIAGFYLLFEGLAWIIEGFAKAD